MRSLAAIRECLVAPDRTRPDSLRVRLYLRYSLSYRDAEEIAPRDGALVSIHGRPGAHWLDQGSRGRLLR
jgi:hypothetical protein